MANESEAVVLTFGLTLQQIIDVVTFVVIIISIFIIIVIKIILIMIILIIIIVTIVMLMVFISPYSRSSLWSVLCTKLIKESMVDSKSSQTIHELGNVKIRVFLKRHFVKNQNPHPTTQQGDTQGEHIQKVRLNKQV